METVILKTFDDDLNAVIDYTVAGTIKIAYSIKTKKQGIYKLLVMSSFKPNCEPVVVDTPEFKNSSAQGTKEITSSEAAYKGYYLKDLDTFVLAVKESGSFSGAAVHFCRLAWDWSSNKFFSHKSSSKTLQRAEEALAGIKTVSSNKAYENCMIKILSFKDRFRKSHLSPIGEFEWYEVGDKVHLQDISAYRHALMQLGENVGFLWGIADNGMTALAVDGKEHFSFPNVSDCTIKTNGFYIAGVLFKEDGQYFAVPAQCNEKGNRH